MHLHSGSESPFRSYSNRKIYIKILDIFGQAAIEKHFLVSVLSIQDNFERKFNFLSF